MMISTPELAQWAIRNVSLNNPPFPLHISVEITGNQKIRLIVNTEVKNRDTGQPWDVRFTFDADLPIEEDRFFEWVESRVRAVFLHEFAECFHVCGIRIRDPHPTVKADQVSDDRAEFDFATPFTTELANHTEDRPVRRG